MNRAVLPIVLIVSSALVTACVEEKAPSVDGMVKVKMCAARETCPPARLGFVVDENRVLAYVGDAGSTDAAGKFSIKTAITGGWVDASSMPYDNKETGLALLKTWEKVNPVYEFGLEPVEKARAVHAATVIDGGHVPLVRGVVTATERRINIVGDGGIVHNALVGEAGYGSPLFNNCGEVVGVVVPAPSVRAENREGRRMTQTLGGQLAVSTAWLEGQLENQGANLGVTLRKAVSACASERTQLIRAMKLDVLFWILLVGAGAAGARVAFLTVTARNGAGGGRSKPPPSGGREETDPDRRGDAGGGTTAGRNRTPQAEDRSCLPVDETERNRKGTEQ